MITLKYDGGLIRFCGSVVYSIGLLSGLLRGVLRYLD